MYYRHSQRFRDWSKEVDETERRKERDKQRDLLTLTHLYFYDEHSPRYQQGSTPQVLPIDLENESLASVSPDRELRKYLASPQLWASARASARCQRRALSLTLESPRLQSPKMTGWARPIAAATRTDGLATPLASAAHTSKTALLTPQSFTSKNLLLNPECKQVMSSHDQGRQLSSPLADKMRR